MEYQPRVNIIHRSLNEVPSIGGVEKRLAIMNGTLTAALLMGSHFPPAVLIGIATHLFFRHVTENEPRIVAIYLRWTKQGARYDPWVHANQNRNHRPDGMGKGNLC